MPEYWCRTDKLTTKRNADAGLIFFWHSGIPAFSKDFSELYSKLSSKGPTFKYSILYISSMNLQGICLHTTSLYTCRLFLFPPSYSSDFRHLIFPVPDWKKCQCWNQPDNGIRKSSAVTECSVTGLSCWMPEWRCRRHRPRYRCPAMVLSGRAIIVVYVYTCLLCRLKNINSLLISQVISESSL
jgi:hypothetical protein